MPVNDNSARANRARSSRRLSVEERFFAKVEFTDAPCTTRPELGPCWLWTASTNSSGYGTFGAGGARNTVQAHRWAYEFCVGSIPDGLTIDHLCRIRLCVNPSHLEPVNLRTNILRGDGQAGKNTQKTHCIHGHLFNRITPQGYRYCLECKRMAYKHKTATGPRTHCRRGHPYTPDNTYLSPNGGKYCRECHRQSVKASTLRVRAN